MTRTDLPVVSLADLPGGPEPAVLCATARLAVSLRRAHGELQAARGATTWRALQSSTPALWLEALSSRALLGGEIPADSVPGSFLARAQERSLWEQAIAADASIAAELFDQEGMAVAAMEAASLQRVWRLEVPAAWHSEEYAAWLRWRQRVQEASRAGGWCSADEATAWGIACIARGLGGLPVRLGLAGFIAADPQVSHLLAVLEARGVELFRVDFGSAAGASAVGIELPEAEIECLAAARWARERLARNPGCRLRIAVADLPVRRRLLETALEDALQPDAVGAGWAAQERAWEFVAGSPLAAESLVDVALRLLRLGLHPQRVAQADVGALLCGNGWSADVGEADARARIEAGLREWLPPETSLERLQRAVARLCSGADDAPRAPQLVAHLAVLTDAARSASRRQLPSAWGAAFAELLRKLDWPGQRELLPVEHAACDDLYEALGGLATLDAVLGRVTASEALRQLQRLCRDRAFAPPRRGGAGVEICSLDDALAGAVDALWVMGLNEGAWPPAPRPNPLLPAELQRRAGIPAARADSLAAAAHSLQALWCASAGEVVLSWAQREGERPLRPSPLLADIPRGELPPDEALPEPVGDEPVERVDDELMERVDDARAPPVGAAEHIRGGTALLKAQAVCPAWGFYQYRLGAAVLPAPTFGLDARARGSLLHAALEEFWRGRSLADLLRMDAATRGAELQRVVAHALADFERHAPEPLPPRLRQLESERLQALLAVWLEVEAGRPPFRVIACEERHTLDIESLPVRVVVDRIDQQDDGRLVVIDYKSGRNDSAESWAAPRITEPQLPIYAALAFPDREVAAVALARVTRDTPAFLGVSADEGLLPGVRSLAQQGATYAEDEFPNWDSLRAVWAERIREVAREVKDGVAAVVFEREADLKYCEVLPLLRLAERQQQMGSAAALPTANADHNPPDPRAALHSGPAAAAQSSALRNPASAPLSGRGGDDNRSPSAPMGERR